MNYPLDTEVAFLLRGAHRIAVVGLSSKPERPSYNVARYLIGKGYEIIPVNPNEREVLGRAAYARLTDVPGRIDIVNLFRRRKFVPGLAAEAAAVGAGALWGQLGVVSEEGERIATEAGLFVVMNRCMEVEHERLIVHGARMLVEAGGPVAVSI
ncbi:MAG: CoA-binding protein [Chloroflexota bacterium]